MYNRRDFIKTFLRTASLGTIALGSSYLIFREESDEVCNFEFVCKNCKKLKNCQLPEAKNYIKQADHG